MKKEGLYCDTCDRKSEDICGDTGWILIGSSSGSVHLSISNGRPNEPTDSTHKSIVCKGYGPEIKELNFCSVRCMLEWMEIVKEEKERDIVEIYSHPIGILVARKEEDDIEHVNAFINGLTDEQIEDMTNDSHEKNMRYNKFVKYTTFAKGPERK